MNSLYVISFLNKLEPICLHTRIAIVSTWLNGFNYCYLTQIILFNINHLFAHSEVATSITILNTNYSIQHYSLICIQSNGSKYCYLKPIIQFRHIFKEFKVLLFISNNLINLSISHLFTQLNSQTVLFDPQRGPYQVLPLQVRVGAIAMKGYSIFSRAPLIGALPSDVLMS